MTDREALKLLKYPVYKWSMDWDEREDGLSYTEAIERAISALQEREERSKGCEFCNTYDFRRCGIDEHRIFMTGGNSRVNANEQFKFCPRCGRPLKGAQDESICM